MNVLTTFQKTIQHNFLLVRCLCVSPVLHSERSKLYDQIIADVERNIKENSKVFARKGFVHHSARSAQSKNANLRSALQSVQQKIMEQGANSISNIPSSASIEVLGNGTCHLRPCVIIRTPFKVYMFNCPEGISRFLPQLRVKSLNVNDIFLTQGTWDNIAGISSILLSKEFNALPTRLHGAMNVKHFLECIRPFQDSDYGTAKYPSQVVELPYTEGHYEDAAVKIEYIPLTPSLNDSTTENRVDIAYYVNLKAPPRRIDLRKVMDLQVPKGPLIGTLKNGNSITLPDGRIINPEDVYTTEDHQSDKETALILDCASIEHVKAFAHHSTFSKIKNSRLHYMVHLSESSVLESPEYKEILRAFDGDCKHIVVNSACPVIPGIESIFRNHRLLHSVCPSLFRPLYPLDWNGLITQGSDLCRREDTLIYAAPLQRFWMREKGGEEPIIIDLRESNNEIPKEAEQLIRNLQTETDNLVLDSEFPRVTFLGTSSAVPSKYRNVTGYILEMSQDSALMVDVGEGSYGQMTVLYGPKGVEELLMKLKCICITHAHQDHMNGLFTILKRRKEAFDAAGKKYIPLVLVLNRNVIKPFKTYSMCFEDLTPLVSLVDISRHPITPPVSPGGPPNKRRRLPSPNVSATRNVLEQMPNDLFDASWCLTELKAVQVHHTRMANGFVFGVNNKRVVFSGDTKPCDLLVEEGKDADLLIHEATFEDGHETDALRKKHSTMGQAIDVGKRMKAKFIILTHFSARYPKVPELPSYLEEHGNVGVAMDFLSVRLDHLSLVPKLVPIYRELYRDELFEIELRKQQRKLRKGLDGDISESVSVKN